MASDRSDATGGPRRGTLERLGHGVRDGALRVAVARAHTGCAALEGLSPDHAIRARERQARRQGAAFTNEAAGLETTAYTFSADQFGTQLDPPAHWHQCFPAIDELPPTLARRKLAVISIVDRVQADPNYHLRADNVCAWEKANSRIPAGCVVMVRSDWSKRWPDAARFQPADRKFPGVSLDALELLHLERRILLHGHEPIDTDSTPTLIGEDWLMNNGYMQAEGVANLDQVPATGSLVAIGFRRLKGGTGGFASFTAICPPGWGHGARPGDVQESPLPYADRRLVWNDATGQRERTAPCDKPKGKLSLNRD